MIRVTNGCGTGERLNLASALLAIVTITNGAQDRRTGCIEQNRPTGAGRDSADHEAL
jgi:hypothetical protein